MNGLSGDSPVRVLLSSVLYFLNLGIVFSLLSAAYFVSQGLFGDLYACNETTLAEVERVYAYPAGQQAQWGLPLCLVDLSYNATSPADAEQPPADEQDGSFFAMQVTIPCERLAEDASGNATWTDICFNRYNPQLFASVGAGGAGATAYTHEDARRDLHAGFRAALWTALLAVCASWLHANLDRTEARLELLGGCCLQGCKQLRARAGALRRWLGSAIARRRAAGEGNTGEGSAAARESEMQRVVVAAEEQV